MPVCDRREVKFKATGSPSEEEPMGMRRATEGHAAPPSIQEPEARSADEKAPYFLQKACERLVQTGSIWFNLVQMGGFRHTYCKIFLHL